MFKVAVLISGKGSNLQSIIDRLHIKNNNIEIKCVISNNKDVLGLKRAKDSDICTYTVNDCNYKKSKEYEKEIINIIDGQSIDLIVLAGYMRLLSPYFIDYYYPKIINIHPSLLPSFPGLNAQQQALDYGVKVSGCTVHFVDKGVDSGPIIKQKAVVVDSNDTVNSLSKRILKDEHKILPEVIKLLSLNKVKLKNRTVIIEER
ncbi:MAG: phosphoribosylglycinamide formyltransferase [Halanaerobiales bacterium]|nr:phosphoribosylglycinamide formyltransferase [Halanaerobiales bacterium]